MERWADVGAASAGWRLWDSDRTEREESEALQRGVTVDYVQGDMRSIPLSDNFDAVVGWFTAYRYVDDEQNRDVLTGVHRTPRPGGRFRWS